MKFLLDIKAYWALARQGAWATLFDLSLAYLLFFRLGSGIYQISPKLFFPIRILEKILEIVFGVYVPFGAKIGGGLVIYHYHGIIINGRTIMGEGCAIYPRVCIGNRYPGDGVPVIGSRVILGTGACIFGPVFIPDEARIPANAVVTPSNLHEYIKDGSS